MDFVNVLLILIGLVISLWVLWCFIINTISELRMIKRCSVATYAEILSWRIEEDSDNPTKCTPTIRYSLNDQVYEVEFWNGTVTLYQKNCTYTNDTMMIWVDPKDPTSAIPEQKGNYVYRTVESAVVVGGIALFFSLLAAIFLYASFF